MKKIFSIFMSVFVLMVMILASTTDINVNAQSANTETASESTYEGYIQPAYGDDDPVVSDEEGVGDKDDYELNNSFKLATNISVYNDAQPVDYSSSVSATLHDVTWFWGIWRYVDEDYYRIDLFGDAYLTITLDVPDNVNYDLELCYHTDDLESGFDIDDLPDVGNSLNGGVGITENISISGSNSVNNETGYSILTAGTYYIRISSHNELYSSGEEYNLSYSVDYQVSNNEEIDKLRFNKGANAAIWKSDFDPYGFETFRFDGELSRTYSKNPFHNVMEDYSTETGIVNSVLYIWNTEWRNNIADYLDEVLEIYNEVYDKNQEIKVTVEFIEDGTEIVGLILNIVGKVSGQPIVSAVGDGISALGSTTAILFKMFMPEVWDTTLQDAIDYFELLSNTLRCTNDVDSTEIVAIKCKYNYELTTINFTPSLSENETFIYSSNTINAYNSESHTYGKIYPLTSVDDYNDFMNTGVVESKADINTCEPIEVVLDEVKNGNLISGKYYWYKFTAPVNGEYRFYTEGSTDTYGELFSSAVSARSTTNRLTNGYNDDSGDGNNFLLEYELSANQVVYLRIRGWNWTRTGIFTFKVETDEHIHDYTYSYEKSTQLVHKAFCYCGAHITSSHSFINNVCSSCGETHTHSYWYVSNGNGTTHTIRCSCGIATTEACIGLVNYGSDTVCVKCNQVMTSGSIIMGDTGNEEDFTLNMIVPFLEENNIIPYLDEKEDLIE